MNILESYLNFLQEENDEIIDEQVTPEDKKKWAEMRRKSREKAMKNKAAYRKAQTMTTAAATRG